MKTIRAAVGIAVVAVALATGVCTPAHAGTGKVVIFEYGAHLPGGVGSFSA